MVDETEDISKLNEIPSLKTSDSTIIGNMTFQLGFAAIAIILFIPIRRKLLWLYSPNTKNKKQHPAYNLSKNYVSWMWPVISTSDVQLLNVIGLDSFMMLQTLKLMYRIFFILALMLIPLMFLYYSGDQARYDQYFLKFTIQNVARKNFYLPLIYVYVNTFVIFYLIFIYYKKHVSIRQAYIRAPSILTSLTSLKRLSFGHKNYLKLIDIKAKSVFMLRIPPFVDTDRELRIFVEALGVGAVEHCALVQDTRKIDSLTSKRDYIARDIEGEIEKAWRMILLEIEKQSKDKENMKEIYTRIKKLEQKHKSEEMAHGDLPKKPEDKDGDDQATQAGESKEPEGKSGDNQPDEDKENDDNGENDQAEELKDHEGKSGDDQADEYKENEDKGENDQTNETKANDDKYSYEQSTQGDGSKGGLSKEKTNKDAHRFLYSKNRYIKRYGKTDALTYKMAQLEKIQKKMVDETARRLKKSVEEKPSDQIIELMNKNNLMYTRVDIANDVSFFSLYQIFYLRKHWHNFTLDLPTNARSAFVTFVNPKSAQILPQCLISSRVFTCKAIPAPVPQDVIWENINRGEVEIYFKKLLGKLIFLLFNSAFYTLVLGVINLIELENLEYYFPSIKVLTDIEVVRSSFDGIITPLIFNALLTIAPIVLTLLTYYEGVYSYSGLYISLTDRFGHFLIFNGFLSFLCSSTFVGMARDFVNKQASFSKFTNEFGNNLIKLSLFFTNTIIQRIVVGNLFAVLKPAKLVLEIFSDKILVMFGSVRSHRSKIEIKLPDNANFGVLYPTLIIVFPIGLTYSVISPLMAILAGFYFFVTYLTYKEEFLYALCNEFESGGTYWDVVSNQMVTSLFIFQAAMICQFIVGHAKFEATLITPLIVVTYMYKDSLKTMFNKSTMFYPLNAQEETYVDDFTEKLIAERKNMVEHWHEELDPTDPNIIKCDDILDKIESERIVDYPYRGSVEGVDCIMFPNKFFEKLEIIKEYDPDDDLGLFSEMKQQPKE